MNKDYRKKQNPPKPTQENPYIQLKWVWERFTKRYKNKLTIMRFDYCLKSYICFLSEKHGFDERLERDPRFLLSVHFDHFVLINAERYWREKGFAPQTIQSYVSTLSIVVDYAASEGLTSVKEFIRPKTASKERATNMYEAYTDEEVGWIRTIISQETNYTANVIGGYIPRGVGSDPRIRSKKINNENISGWKHWDNLVWYFENVMHCKAMPFSKNSIHKTFFYAAQTYHGGLESVWRKLKATPFIDTHLIAALVLKLAWETGLNAGSIFDLKYDCYQESHELTNLPYIKYYKERSTGEKELHISLFDDKEDGRIHLMPKQSEVIRRTIDLILKITEPLRSVASENDKKFLFIVQNSSVRNKIVKVGAVMRLDQIEMRRGISFIRKKMREADIEIKSLSLVRFRATKITQMVRDGYDFFHIQAVAGHSQLKTTIEYINSQQLTVQARKELDSALKHIHRSVQVSNYQQQQEIGVSLKQQVGTIYKGVMGDCQNVYDPPKAVKNLKTYKKGQSCTYWNMCLFCPNIMITRRHLPRLVGYSDEIKMAFNQGNLVHAPNATHYKKAERVLEEIFREFSAEDIEWARSVADSEDFFLDGVTYRGIKNEK